MDDDTRVAPLAEPDGHTRFVIDAAPDGACPLGPFVWASYANPDDDRPLTSVFVEPAARTPGRSERIVTRRRIFTVSLAQDSEPYETEKARPRPN